MSFSLKSFMILITVPLELSSKLAITTCTLSTSGKEIPSSSNWTKILSIPHANPMQPTSSEAKRPTKLLYLPPPNKVGCPASPFSLLLISKTKFV